MKEYNGMKIIGVDHGYGNIKTVNDVFPTGLVAYNSQPAFGGSVLEYAGRYYTVGENHKDFTEDKTVDEDYYILTLMAVALELRREGLTEADVWLAVGLPMTWVRRQRKAFERYLLQNKKVTFRYGTIEYHIRFEGCSIYPQGYPAIVDQLQYLCGNDLLVDIGNGTCNVLTLLRKKPIESRSWTEKMGVEQCVIRAQAAIMNRFGTVLDGDVVQQLLCGEEVSLRADYAECIKEVAVGYVQDLFGMLHRHEYNPATMQLIVMGGGCTLVRRYGAEVYDEERTAFLPDICAAAKGYELLAYNFKKLEGSHE